MRRRKVFWIKMSRPGKCWKQQHSQGSAVLLKHQAVPGSVWHRLDGPHQVCTRFSSAEVPVLAHGDPRLAWNSRPTHVEQTERWAQVHSQISWYSARSGLNTQDHFPEMHCRNLLVQPHSIKTSGDQRAVSRDAEIVVLLN